MNQPYQLLNSSNVGSLDDVIDYANGVIEPTGTLGFLLLFMLFSIAFLAFGGLPFDRRVLATLGVTSAFSVLLTIAGLIGSYYAPTLIIITFVAWVLVKDK